MSSGKPRVRSIFIFFVEIFSIILAALFVLAALLLWAIFSVWGLNFFSFGTPVDVLMSGIALGVWATPYVLVGYLAFELSRRNEVALLIFIFIVLVSLLALSVSGVLAIGSIAEILQNQVLVLKLISVIINPVVAMMLLAMFVNVVALYRLHERGNKDLTARSMKVSVIPVFLFLSISTFVFLLSEGGLQESDLFLNSEVEHCSKPNVLWVGERSTVVRCNRKKIIVIQTSALSFTPAPPVWSD